MSNALSSHGTLIARETAPGVFTTIGELGDITPPPLTRPSTEVTPQNDKIDSYVMGVIKRGEATFPINFIPSGESTHDAVTGILKAYADKSLDGYKITWPDASNTTWIFSGYVANFATAAPAREGAVSADVTLRPSGGHIIDGTAIGV